MLHFLPEPTPDDSGDHYLPFEQVFGSQLTDDKYHPSARQNTSFDEDSQDIDKQNRDLLKTEKVQDAIHCGECDKPRCVYSPSKLIRVQEAAIETLKRETSFICGDGLSEMIGLVVRRCVSCTSDVEIHYFSAKCRHYFPPVCVYCGSQRELLNDNDSYIALYEKFSVLRPLCSACHVAGKDVKTWGAKFLKKRK